MSRGRDAVRMADAEVASFLVEERKVHVASLGPDGTPHQATLFYVVDGARIGFWTYRASQKVRNLERDPRLSCLVEAGDEYHELRGVSIRGRAEIVRERREVLRIGAAVATRMTGVARFEDLGDAGRQEVERQAATRVAVVVHPRQVASWDHRKLLG